jgi:hypothetical protein
VTSSVAAAVAEAVSLDTGTAELAR